MGGGGGTGEEIEDNVIIFCKGFYVFSTNTDNFRSLKGNPHLREKISITASVIQKRWNVFIHIFFQKVLSPWLSCFINAKNNKPFPLKLFHC